MVKIGAGIDERRFFVNCVYYEIIHTKKLCVCMFRSRRLCKRDQEKGWTY